MPFRIEMKHLIEIREHPHLLGHCVGKDLLTEMHSDWIKELWLSQDHTALQAHRGAYKTTAVTEIGIIWWLLFHPSDRVALVRKPYTEAAKTLSAIKKYFQVESIQAIFHAAHGFVPKPVVQKEGSLVFNFKRSVTKEGSIDAWGIDQQMTGNHYDIVICDDIVVLKDRLSRAEREKTKEGLREILTNIIDPGKHAMIVGTPWHKADAWTICPEPAKYTVLETGIVSEAEQAKKRAQTTESLYAANYLLVHQTDKNAIFQNPVYEPWKWGIGKVFAHLDAKFGGDHTAALTIMFRRPDHKIQAIGWVFHENVKDKIQWIQKLCRKYKVKRIYIENNPDKGYTADQLESPDRETGKKGIKASRYSESTNKHIKIVSYLKRYWDEILWAKEMLEPEAETCRESHGEYMEQLVDYREGQEPDDAPDSAASLLREAFYAQDKPSKNGLYEM